MADLNELEKLNELKNKGIISQEEFDAQKAKILSSLNQPSAGGKSQVAYCVLALFLGSWGIHNFYAGRWKRGLTQLILTLSSFLTLFIGNIISILWSTINIFTIHTDGKGKEFQPSPTAKYICGIFSILWVLLILGVLALGGIAGYNMAMNRHRTNQMEDLATRLAIASQTYENTNTNNTYQEQKFGGIIGAYDKAMLRHNANQATDYATRLAIAAQTINGTGLAEGETKTADELGLGLAPEHTGISAENVVVSKNNGIYEVQLNITDPDLLEEIKNVSGSADGSLIKFNESGIIGE